MPATILTVLRSGGGYLPQHAYRLYEQTRPHPFLCLTDFDLSIPHEKLRHNWPSWWPKIEALSIPGPVLYMDLDTSVTGDIAPLLDAVQEHDFIALRNPLPTPSRFGSGLLGWRGDMSHVYQRFAKDPQHHMRRCTTQCLWGDQGFIAEDHPNPVFWQDLFPGEILSWKVECKTGVPSTARVIYFHGSVKPWHVGQ